MRQADLRLRRRAVASQHGSQLESSGQDAPDDDTYGKIRSIAIQQRAVSAVPPRPCPGERDFQTNSQVARPDREVTAGEALMEDSAKEQSAVMLFERNDRLVCEAFRNGDFDYIDAAGELSETDFFRAIASKQILDKLAASYPSPSKKHEVPLWVYIASNISCAFMGSTSSTPILTWCALAGWFRPLVRRWAIRPCIPIPEISPSRARASTTKTTMTGRPLAIRTTCARWRAEPMRIYCICGSTGMSRASSNSITPSIQRASLSGMAPTCLFPTTTPMKARCGFSSMS